MTEVNYPRPNPQWLTSRIERFAAPDDENVRVCASFSTPNARQADFGVPPVPGPAHTDEEIINVSRNLIAHVLKTLAEENRRALRFALIYDAVPHEDGFDDMLLYCDVVPIEDVS